MMDNFLIKILSSSNFDKSKVLNPGGNNSIKIDTTTKSLNLTNILNQIYIWAGIICVIVVVVAGIFYVISAGDSGKVAKAKTALTYALVGLGIIIMAFAITNFVIGAI